MGGGSLFLLHDHCWSDSAFRRDDKRVLIILHCNALPAERQEMLLNFQAQMLDSKGAGHSPEEVDDSSVNAVLESHVQLVL